MSPPKPIEKSKSPERHHWPEKAPEPTPTKHKKATESLDYEDWLKVKTEREGTLRSLNIQKKHIET